jgi:hypothetical protein
MIGAFRVCASGKRSLICPLAMSATIDHSRLPKMRSGLGSSPLRPPQGLISQNASRLPEPVEFPHRSSADEAFLSAETALSPIERFRLA